MGMEAQDSPVLQPGLPGMAAAPHLHPPCPLLALPTTGLCGSLPSWHPHREQLSLRLGTRPGLGLGAAPQS